MQITLRSVTQPLTKALQLTFLVTDLVDKQLSIQVYVKVLTLFLLKMITFTTIQLHSMLESQHMPLGERAHADYTSSNTQTAHSNIQTIHAYTASGIAKYNSTSNTKQPAAPSTSDTLFKPLKPFKPLQEYHIKLIYAPICRYNKHLQTAI